MKKKALKAEASGAIFIESKICQMLFSLRKEKAVKITTEDMTGTMMEFTFNKPSRDLNTASSVKRHIIMIPTIFGMLKKALKTSQLPENIIEVPKNKNKVMMKS